MSKAKFVLTASIALVAAIAACSSKPGTPLPCAVNDVLVRNCQKCHSDPQQFGAPMPLVTWENLHAPAKSNGQKKVFEMIAVRTHDDAKPMPQPPNPRLNAVDQKTIDDWIAAGAPQAGFECADGGSIDGGSDAPTAPPPCTPDVTLKAASAWTMPETTGDEYVCYGVDVPVTGKRHVIGFTPMIDNKTIVHHIVLFQNDTATNTTPTPCNVGSSLTKRMIYGWAPGGQPLTMPLNVGLPIEGTAHFIVQIHYSNLKHLNGEVDQTAIGMCTADPRENEADVMAFGSMQFTIPAHGSLDMDCTAQVPGGAPPVIHVFESMPHMHQVGKAIGSKVGTTTIDEVKAWSFSYQPWNAVSIDLHPGDLVTTNCAWDNPTDLPISYGEKTSDEMCYHFMMYYPRLTIPLWNWSVPSLTSSCTPK